jgi:hypothetical protein
MLTAPKAVPVAAVDRYCCAGGLMVDGTKQNGLRVSALVLGGVQFNCASSTRPEIASATCGNATPHNSRTSKARLPIASYWCEHVASQPRLLMCYRSSALY